MNHTISIIEKLEILSDAAKYDVACTSSGVDRKGKGTGMGNAVAGGICHCFSQDGRCISLLKILYSNDCVYDCKYCINRRSNDVRRASFTPREVAELTIDFYKRNYIEGLFLSSGILNNPDYTMERILETVILLREVYQFNGYIHVKAIPGADAELIERTGWFVDRMSANLELPTAEGLKALAPNKNRKNILRPMRQIQLGRERNLIELTDRKKQNLSYHDPKQLPFQQEKRKDALKLQEENRDLFQMAELDEKRSLLLPQKIEKKLFVPAGQSTQMIVGATPESDYQMLKVAEALYQNFDLKRVFYSAFINTTMDSALPVLSDGPPLLREHRLYQADWLLRFYHFAADEILSEKNPYFNVVLDPKCNWAIHHLEQFPIEINQADYHTLLRVPGIGVKSARRIVMARKSARLDFTDIKKLGVVLKRALYFITCKGRMMYPVKMEEKYILSHMLDINQKILYETNTGNQYEQLSLFEGGVFKGASL